MNNPPLTSLFESPEFQPTAALHQLWESNAVLYSIIFPPDFVTLQNLYGPGKFCGTYLTLFSPFSSQYQGRVETGLSGARSFYTKGKKYPVYPELPGLFPWGSDEDGCRYYWYMEGSPENWPVFYELGEIKGSGLFLEFSRVARPLVGRVAERQEGAFASLFDQRGVSPLQVGALRPVSESNCVVVRRGGKQLEENDQSVTLCELDSAGLSGEPAFLW